MDPAKIARDDSEDSQQIALFCWAANPHLRAQYPELRLMHHIPNGGSRNKAEAAKLKAMGVKAGVPDVFLPAARSGFHGLYVELKRANGVVSKEQQEMLDLLHKAGYYVVVCYNWLSAAETICAYLDGGYDELAISA